MGTDATLRRAVALTVAAVLSAVGGLFVSYIAFAFYRLAPWQGYLFLTALFVFGMLTYVHRTMRR